MRRTIRGKTSYSESFLEKFSMVYMEIQELDEAPTKKTLWHLEDEQRKLVALCGRTLHDVCKSVSPALAMLGTPCSACIKIVRSWLQGKHENTRNHRMKSLVMADVDFRNNVQRIVSPEMFVANFVGSDHSEKDLSKLTGKKNK